MRLISLLVGVLALAAAMASGAGERSPPPRVPAAYAKATGELMALTAVYGRVQQVSVIDPRERVLAVYHVDLTTGKAELKSVRKIHWDLQIEEFEGSAPLPQEVRTLVEQQ